MKPNLFGVYTYLNSFGEIHCTIRRQGREWGNYSPTNASLKRLQRWANDGQNSGLLSIETSGNNVMGWYAKLAS